MKITRASSYALHALAHMAMQKPDKEGKYSVLPSHKIAEARGVPERFLLKVLKPLVTTGILDSVKGPSGGYKLKKAPKDITVLEIIEAVDGPIRPQGSSNDSGNSSAINARLDKLSKDTAELERGYLRKVSLADIAGKK
jgi:Rrf2 family protein